MKTSAGAILFLIVVSSVKLVAQPPAPGQTAAAPAKPLLSPHAATIALTGQPMAINYYVAIFRAVTNELTATNGQYGIYCSPIGAGQNRYLGYCTAPQHHISFSGPLPTNPISLWATYTGGGSTPVITLDTNLTGLSTDPSQPKGIFLINRLPLAPVTNLTLTVSPAYPTITYFSTPDFVNWTAIGSTTNGVLNVDPQGHPFLSLRCRVDAAPVTLTWTPVNNPSVTGYQIGEYDMNTNIIALFDAGLATNVTITILRPDKCVQFACQAYDRPDMEIGPNSNFAKYIARCPKLTISR